MSDPAPALAPNIDSPYGGPNPVGGSNPPVPATVPTGAPTATTPSTFSLNPSGDPTSSALASYTSMNSIKQMLDDNQAKLNATLVPTDAETALKKQIADVQAGEANTTQGLKQYENNLQGEGISSGAIQGRSLDMERGVNLTLERMGIQEKNLLTRLGLEQDARTVQEKIATNNYGETKDLIDYASKAQAAIDKQKTDLATATNVLTDNARQSLQLILTQFKGMDYHNLSPSAQLKLQSISNQLDIPIGVIIQGMQVVKNQNDLDNLNKAKSLNIEQQNANTAAKNAANKDTGLNADEVAFKKDLDSTITKLVSGGAGATPANAYSWAQAYDTLANTYGKTNPDLVRPLSTAEIIAAKGDPKVDETYLDILLNKSKYYQQTGG